MSRYQQGAVIAIELLLVLAVIGLTAYEVVNHPDGDNTKLLIGAVVASFGGIGSHLFSGKAS